MIERTGRILALGTAALALAACDSTQGPEMDPAFARGGAMVWQADLLPLNPDVSFAPVTGKVLLQLNGDRLKIVLNATGLEPGIPHPQHIHGALGTPEGMCPDMADDANGDGVIDVIEGVPDYGAILLTLDSDLTNGATTEVEGLPVGSDDGTIHYSATVSWSAMAAGLGGVPTLENREIVLHGVNPDTPLPAAASIGALPAWLTLPVACGQIDRVN